MLNIFGLTRNEWTNSMKLCVQFLFLVSFKQLLQHRLGHLHRDHLSAYSNDAICKNPFFNDDFAAFEFFDSTTHFEFDSQGRRFEIVHVEGGGKEARIWFRCWVFFLQRFVHGRGGCPCAVTVYKGGE